MVTWKAIYVSCEIKVGENMKIWTRLTNRHIKSRLLIGLSIFSVLFVFVTQLQFLNPFVSSWDQVDFSLAVHRFDLMAMQPHFPGYPFFILGGKFIYLFVANPSEALTVFNILFYASTLFPIYKLCRAFLSRSYSSLTTAIIYSSSYCLIMVNQPMSEGSALSAFWWYVWSLLFALKTKNTKAILFPLALLSLMLGIRLSYFPFSIGILFLYYWKVKHGGLSIKQVIYYTCWGVFFQAIWLTGLVISEGSLIGFIKLSLAFTSGHFNDWGGSIETSKISFVTRFIIFIGNNIFWTGMASKHFMIASIYLFCFIVVLSRIYEKQRVNRPFMTLLYLMFISYFVWALLGQNIDKARHALPLVSLLILFLCIRLFTNRVTLLILTLSGFLLGLQIYHDVNLIREQATESPAIYKMNNYVQGMGQPVILYTWEETRVLQYLNAPYTHKRIETYQLFQIDSKYFENRTVLLTDKVVKGFISQDVSLKGKIEKVKTFQSNELFEPVYHDITLYKWVGK